MAAMHHARPSAPRLILALLLCGLALGWTDPVEARKLDREMAAVRASDLGLPDAQRWSTFQAVDRLFDLLWRKPAGHKVIRRGTGQAIAPLPALTLEDRSGDGQADFFAYGSSDGKARSQEFGAFLDRNGDGRIDWLVYYGGMMLSGAGNFYFWHHHAIDADGDGRFDIRVYTAVDADGDGSADEGATVWLEDSDRDGRIDRAVRIVKGVVTPIALRDGAFPLGYVLATDASEQPRPGGPLPVETMAAVTADIAALLSGK